MHLCVLSSSGWLFVCVFRGRSIDFCEIDFPLLTKSVAMLKVTNKIDVRADEHLRTICPHRATYAADLPRPPFLQRSTAPCPLSFDVLTVHAQVDHIMDQLAPSIMICTVAGSILLGLVLLVSVSWFVP